MTELLLEEFCRKKSTLVRVLEAGHLPRNERPLDAPITKPFLSPDPMSALLSRIVNVASFSFFGDSEPKGCCRRLTAEAVLAGGVYGENEWIRESMSSCSSFASSRVLRSLTSASRDRTLSSSDSVYPRGNALLDSLSDVLHSKPTLEHCVQQGRMPSHRIFLERQRSQACAIRVCELPHLMSFMGRIPGMIRCVDL